MNASQLDLFHPPPLLLMLPLLLDFVSSLTNLAIMVIGGFEDEEAPDQELHEHVFEDADTDDEAAATLCCVSMKILLTLLVAIVCIYYSK